MKNKSFTLIEMITVLVIIGVISAITLPFFFSFYGGQELKTSAGIVASVLRTAKSYAAAKNMDYQVGFVIPQSNKLEMTIYEQPAHTQVGKTEKLELSSSVIFTITFTGKIATFTPQGTNNGGTVTIDNTGKSKKIDVTVSAVTGRVKIWDIEEY